MAQKPETVFRSGQVVPFLKTLKHTKFMPIQQAAINGDPDFVLCCRGYYIDLELKADGEEPTPLQEFKQSETERCGGRVLVTYPANWAHIKRIIKKLDEEGEIA
jgi:hypothetical protein